MKKNGTNGISMKSAANVIFFNINEPKKPNFIILININQNYYRFYKDL